MSDYDERDESTTEGVRILGAQPASEGGKQSEAGASEARDDATEALVADEEIPRWPQEGPSWSASATGTDEVAAEATSPELPHWSEPPTGQVPAVFGAGDDAAAGDDDAWAAMASSQPRFRAEGGDWAEADFTAALADDVDEPRSGVLSEPEPDVADDDAAFAEAVQARRRSGSRPVVTSTPDPRAARPGSPSTRSRRAGATAPGDVLPTGASGGDRDLNVALLSAAAFALIAIVCFAMGQTATALLVAGVLGVCSFELCAALHEKGLRPATVPVVLARIAMPLVSFQAYRGFDAFPVMFTLVTIISFLWFLWQAGPGRPVVGVAVSVMVFAYIGGLGVYAALMLQARHGVGLLLGTVLVVIAYDAFGYFAGTQFGNAPIAPKVSPNKTVEGTLVGIAMAIVVAAIAFHFINPWKQERLTVQLAVGLLIGVATLLGDLSESLLKRDLAVKDFGTMLPGHGGFLDRFDGLLFALPVAFYVAAHLKVS